MAGVLFAQSYFDRNDPAEREIRDLADKLYRRVEWSWMQPRPPLDRHGVAAGKRDAHARLQRLRRGDDPLRAGAGLSGACDLAGRVEGPHRKLQVGHVLRPAVHQLRAALHSSVLAHLARLPRHPRRLHPREGGRLLRELAAGHLRAAGVCRREPERLSRLRREHVGADRVDRTDGRQRDPRTEKRFSSTPTGRAAPAAETSATTAPSRRRPPADRCRSRPRSSCRP